MGKNYILIELYDLSDRDSTKDLESLCRIVNSCGILVFRNIETSIIREEDAIYEAAVAVMTLSKSVVVRREQSADSYHAAHQNDFVKHSVSDFLTAKNNQTGQTCKNCSEEIYYGPPTLNQGGIMIPAGWRHSLTDNTECNVGTLPQAEPT